MKQTVYILVGLPGSGKSTAARFYQKQNLPVVRMGDITDILLKEQGLMINEKNEKEIRNRLRTVYGEDIYAIRTVEKIEEECADKEVLIIEGMRSRAELAYFKKSFAFVNVVYLEVDDQVRYKRLHTRDVRPLTKKEAKARDEWERKMVDTADLKKNAEYHIENNGTKEELYRKLLDVI